MCKRRWIISTPRPVRVVRGIVLWWFCRVLPSVGPYSGFEEWRVCHESEHYNWKEIRRRIRDLRALRHAANGPGIAHVLPQEMHRNVGGICNPELFQYYTGTKRLIDDYYQVSPHCAAHPSLLRRRRLVHMSSEVASAVLEPQILRCGLSG